jgi:hypothetical protein
VRKRASTKRAATYQLTVAFYCSILPNFMSLHGSIWSGPRGADYCTRGIYNLDTVGSLVRTQYRALFLHRCFILMSCAAATVISISARLKIFVIAWPSTRPAASRDSLSTARDLGILRSVSLRGEGTSA